MINKEENCLNVKMLGKFEISYQGIVLSVDMIHSNMMELLLIYMILHRSKDVLTNDLAEALWSEDESDNPMGALKNLMYRLRRLLKTTFGRDDFIVTGRGIYVWNKDIEVCLDSEEFENYLKSAKRVDNPNRKEDLIAALDLYDGTFLPKQVKVHWILQQKTYFNSLFLNNIKLLIEIYDKEDDYEQVEKLCRTALKYDNLDENIHYYLMLSFIKQDKKMVAINHYDLLKRILADELGVSPSEKIQQLHQSLLRKDNEKELELVIIQQDLNEKEIAEKAYLCDYVIFKEIYRLEARRLERLGMSIYCCLVTCDLVLPIPPTSQLYATTFKKLMDELENVLASSLRCGDVVSRYSNSQFVVLLPACTYESTKVILNRVSSKFENNEIGKKGKLAFDFKELILPDKEKGALL